MHLYAMVRACMFVNPAFERAFTRRGGIGDDLDHTPPA